MLGLINSDCGSITVESIKRVQQCFVTDKKKHNKNNIVTVLLKLLLVHNTIALLLL